MATTSRNMREASGWDRFLNFVSESQLGNRLVWAIMILLILTIIFPIFWVLRTAIISPTAVIPSYNQFIPQDRTLDNFARVLGTINPASLAGQENNTISAGVINFWLYLRNSFIVATSVALGQTLFSAMAAYAFARLNFPLRDKIFFIYLTGLMIPGIVLFLPNFILMRQLGWINTFQGIIAPSILMSPFAIFFMRQFFLSLNKDLEEAAVLDGATVFDVFWRISLPLMKGPLLTLGLLTFIGSWNDYLWPYLIGKDENVRVLTVALSVFQQQKPQGGTDWAGLMAGAIVSIVPTVVLFIFFGRRVVDSIQFSGFK